MLYAILQSLDRARQTGKGGSRPISRKINRAKIDNDPVAAVYVSRRKLQRRRMTADLPNFRVRPLSQRLARDR
jgi:hypothetical protein